MRELVAVGGRAVRRDNAQSIADELISMAPALGRSLLLICFPVPLPPKMKIAELRADEQKLKADRDKKAAVPLNGLSLMHQDLMGGSRFDYSLPPLPKNKIPYPRDNMMDQLLSLYDLKAPLTINVRSSSAIC